MIKTTIQWASPFSLGLVLALAVAAALAFVLLRRAAGGPLAPARRRGLWALRGLILAVLALILLNPVRVEETPGAVERPKVVYLVDTSQSMALGKAESPVGPGRLDDPRRRGRRVGRRRPAGRRLPVRQPAGGGRVAVLATADPTRPGCRPSARPPSRPTSRPRRRPTPTRS